jgi:hypothetical protein
MMEFPFTPYWSTGPSDHKVGPTGGGSGDPGSVGDGTNENVAPIGEYSPVTMLPGVKALKFVEIGAALADIGLAASAKTSADRASLVIRNPSPRYGALK